MRTAVKRGRSKSLTLARKKARTRSRLRAGDWALAGNNPARHISFSGYGFPDSLTTNLAYSESIVLTPTAVSPQQVQRYSMNGMYDPLYETGGLQPYWWDQLVAVYSRYQVMGARITVKFAYGNQTAANIGPTIVGIQTTESTSISTTDAGVLMSTSNTSYDVLTTNYDTKTVTATYSPKQAYGGLITDALTAATSGNPSRNWLAHVFINTQGSVLTTPVNVIVKLEFRVKFTNQTQNAGS